MTTQDTHLLCQYAYCKDADSRNDPTTKVGLCPDHIIKKDCPHWNAYDVPYHISRVSKVWAKYFHALSRWAHESIRQTTLKVWNVHQKLEYKYCLFDAMAANLPTLILCGIRNSMQMSFDQPSLICGYPISVGLSSILINKLKAPNLSLISFSSPLLSV